MVPWCSMPLLPRRRANQPLCFSGLARSEYLFLANSNSCRIPVLVACTGAFTSGCPCSSDPASVSC